MREVEKSLNPRDKTRRLSRPGRLKRTLDLAMPALVLGAGIIGFWYYISYGLLAERRRFLLRPAHQVIEVGFLDGFAFGRVSVAGVSHAHG